MKHIHKSGNPYPAPRDCAPKRSDLLSQKAGQTAVRRAAFNSIIPSMRSSRGDAHFPPSRVQRSSPSVSSRPIIGPFWSVIRGVPKISIGEQPEGSPKPSLTSWRQILGRVREYTRTGDGDRGDGGGEGLGGGGLGGGGSGSGGW